MYLGRNFVDCRLLFFSRVPYELALVGGGGGGGGEKGEQSVVPRMFSCFGVEQSDTTGRACRRVVGLLSALPGTKRVLAW